MKKNPFPSNGGTNLHITYFTTHLITLATHLHFLCTFDQLQASFTVSLDPQGLKGKNLKCSTSDKFERNMKRNQSFTNSRANLHTIFSEPHLVTPK